MGDGRASARVFSHFDKLDGIFMRFIAFILIFNMLLDLPPLAPTTT